MDFKNYIASVPDYPEEGITFRDITPLLADGPAYRAAIMEIVDYLKDKDIDVIVGPEARGFIFGCPVAVEMGIGFVPTRKKGKLPRPTTSVSYGLEYGVDILELHSDAIKPGQRVAFVDDLLATGGTTRASFDLVKKSGGEVVTAAFLIELDDLKGAEKMDDVPYFTLLNY